MQSTLWQDKVTIVCLKLKLNVFPGFNHGGA